MTTTKASVTKVLKTALESNKVVLGRDVTMKGIKAGKITAVVFASNCPQAWKQNVSETGSKVETYDYNGNGLDLGALCKRPFAVTVAGILK